MAAQSSRGVGAETGVGALIVWVATQACSSNPYETLDPFAAIEKHYAARWAVICELAFRSPRTANKRARPAAPRGRTSYDPHQMNEAT